MPTLYSYFRSSAAYRVRIALALKQLPYEVVPVHLLKDGGQQHSRAYAEVNPAELVPALVDDGHVLSQSLAILEYLEETRPAPPLLPKDALERAHVRAIAQTIACEIHPLNNLRVLQHLERHLGVGAQERKAWYEHWVTEGLRTVEGLLTRSGSAGLFCHGDRPTIADCCLVPQVYNARRFEISLEPFPTLTRIADHCAGLPAFEAASPERQVDAA